MCNLLKNEFGLCIVPAVLKTALKKLDFLKREKNVYTLDRLLSSDNVKEIEEQIEQSKYIVSSIIDEYINYKKEKNKVGCIDEPSTKEGFCKFIIDGNAIEDVDTGIISAFIVERKGRADFEQACKYIREGLVIYNGLSYNADGELLEKIDTPLTIWKRKCYSMRRGLMAHCSRVYSQISIKLFPKLIWLPISNMGRI